MCVDSEVIVYKIELFFEPCSINIETNFNNYDAERDQIFQTANSFYVFTENKSKIIDLISSMIFKFNVELKEKIKNKEEELKNLKSSHEDKLNKLNSELEKFKSVF